MKIGVQFSSKNGRETEYKNFANLKWGPAAILKNVFGYISATFCPERNLIGRSRITLKHWSRDQCTKFHNMQDGGRLLLKMVSSLYVTRGNPSISMKFGGRTQILVSRMPPCGLQGC